MPEISSRRRASNQHRKLGKIKEALASMSCDWGDIDHYFESRLDRLAKEVEEMESEMKEFVQEA